MLIAFVFRAFAALLLFWKPFDKHQAQSELRTPAGETSERLPLQTKRWLDRNSETVGELGAGLQIHTKEIEIEQNSAS